MELELINFELELKFPKKKLNQQINLPFNFLIQKYFFHDNPTSNINYSIQVGIPGRYSEQVLREPTHSKKRVSKNRSGNFGIGTQLELIYVMWNWNGQSGIDHMSHDQTGDPVFK